jgi:gas vesicle protein
MAALIEERAMATNSETRLDTKVETLASEVDRLAAGLIEFRIEMQRSLTDFRTEMRDGLSEFRVEMQRSSSDFRTSLQEGLTEFKAEMQRSLAEFRTEVQRSTSDFRSDLTDLKEMIAKQAETSRQQAETTDRLVRLVEEMRGNRE